MRQLALLFLSACFLQAQPTLGNYRIAQITPAAGISHLNIVNAAAGSTIWLMISSDAANGDCPGATFTFSGTLPAAGWVKIGSNTSTTFECVAQWYYPNVPAISNGTISVDPTPNYNVAMAYVEIVPPAGSTVVFDASCTGTAASGAFNECSGALAPSASALIVAGAGNYYAVTTFAGANGFTVPASGAITKAAIATLSTSSSVTPRLSITGGSGAYGGIVAASFVAGTVSSGVRRKVVIQ